MKVLKQTIIYVSRNKKVLAKELIHLLEAVTLAGIFRAESGSLLKATVLALIVFVVSRKYSNWFLVASIALILLFELDASTMSFIDEANEPTLAASMLQWEKLAAQMLESEPSDDIGEEDRELALAFTNTVVRSSRGYQDRIKSLSAPLLRLRSRGKWPTGAGIPEGAHLLGQMSVPCALEYLYVNWHEPAASGFFRLFLLAALVAILSHFCAHSRVRKAAPISKSLHQKKGPDRGANSRAATHGADRAA